MPITKTLPFLPAQFQSEANKKFLNATLDQLVTDPNTGAINGYVGRKFAPSSNDAARYVTEPSVIRSNYQLEPGIVVKDSITGETTFTTTYPEFLQKVNYLNGVTSDPNKLCSSEYYSYDPNIDLDKFVNFGQYYWVPAGPSPVQIYANEVDSTREFNISLDEGRQIVTFEGFNNLSNPQITLMRGGNYEFNINQLGYDFWIQTDPGTNGRQLINTNISSREVLGVSNNGTSHGVVSFVVPDSDAQDYFVSMPVVRVIDLATTLLYSELQGANLADIIDQGGIDGQVSNLDGKYLIFVQTTAYSDDWWSSDNPAWLAPGETVTEPIERRHGVWQIQIAGGVITLVFVETIPIANKVIVQSGTELGNTQWYTKANLELTKVPVITASSDILYYQIGNLTNAYGTIKIVDAGTNIINVEEEILGQLTYRSPNGIVFTNGLKIEFDSFVTPSSYRNKQYYVDCVGTGIRLVSVDSLIFNPTQLTTTYDISEAFVDGATAQVNKTNDGITITISAMEEGRETLIGTFPNENTSNQIVSETLTFTYPYRGSQNAEGIHESIQYNDNVIAMTVTGIPIKGVTSGITVPGANNTSWTLIAQEAKIQGQDVYGGTVDDRGEYYYTSSDFITANAWAAVEGFTDGYYGPTGHSKLIGIAADGYPIYGTIGIVDANLELMTSSYQSSDTGAFRPAPVNVTLTANVVANISTSNYLTVNSTFGLNPGMTMSYGGNDYVIVNAGQATATGTQPFDGALNQIKLNKPLETNISVNTSVTFSFLAGAFIEDWEYVEGSGQLDRYNGKENVVTPEYPNGTYAYFASQDVSGKPVYPYFVGPAYYGDPTFNENVSLAEADYITINRSSLDINAWSRRNRWFHRDVLQVTALYNEVPFTLPYEKARRPIIEFKPDLQLYNFGKIAKDTVDLIDTVTTDPFVSIEGAVTAEIDGILLTEGMRVIFAADADSRTNGKTYIVTLIDHDDDSPTPTPNLIHLIEADDSTPIDGQTVAVFSGDDNAGKIFWYNGVEWLEGQAKTALNQFPLFDVFDADGVSFGDTEKYPVVNSETAFTGTKLFNYTIGTGTNDSVLGFPISYRSISNAGDISFTNYFDTDTFSYAVDGTRYDSQVNVGFLHKNNANGSYELVNGWHPVNYLSKQYQLFDFVYDGVENLFTIDVTPEVDTVVPNLFIFVNYKQVSKDLYTMYTLANGDKQIWIDKSALAQNDKVTVKVYSQSVSKIGYYEVPENLNNNIQNSTISGSTLGDLRNHIKALTQNSLDFVGSFPGVSNLRDIDVTKQGGTILQHSAPLSYAMMFLSSDGYSFVRSVQLAEQEYTRFKNKFIKLSESEADIPYMEATDAVDFILTRLNEFKTNEFPWYYSDMVPYGNNKRVNRYTIFDITSRNYEISFAFNKDIPNNSAVLVYLNGVQLLSNLEYDFLNSGLAVRILDTTQLTAGDVLTIVEYYDTDGCCIPETPSKLGLYPKFYPEVIVDDTYTTPQSFIRGHDGSLTPLYNDFRDSLILELERRIYNNIKVAYDSKLIDIYKAKPGKFRDDFTVQQYNKLVAITYLPWIGYNQLDYTTNDVYNADNLFSYNYSSSPDKIDGENLPGSWRACFEYFYDTQRPHTNPWEMLGFSNKPLWWEDTYGPAPYAAGNQLLWDDLEAGYIAGGDRAGVDERFKRPGLSAFIPVDLNGNLKPPIGLLTNQMQNEKFSRDWLAGQWSPVETAWRTSSNYPFATQIIMALSDTAKYFGLGIATHKTQFNDELNQYVNRSTTQRLKPIDVEINGFDTETKTVTRAAGYINWIADYQTNLGILDKSDLKHFVKDYSVNLIYRMAGYTDKKSLKVLAEQNSPNSINDSVIIPDSDFELILNKSTPTSNVRYSAVAIEKVATGFKISGYDNDNPYFNVVLPNTDQVDAGDIAVNRYAVKWYTTFTNLRVSLPYGTVLNDLQQVANFLAGYENWLKIQGFRFEQFDGDLGQLRDWQLSVREFLFWVQQGWVAGSVIVLSPTKNGLTFFNPTSVVDSLADSRDGSRIMTQNFQILDSNSYSVVRDTNIFNVRLNTSSDLIALAVFDTVQYEHALIFNNKTQFNDIIYVPESGQRQYRLKLVGTKTIEWTGALNPQGFIYNGAFVDSWKADTDYLRGDLVEYKGLHYTAIDNLPGSGTFDYSKWLFEDKDNFKTGLLPNFASKAKQFEQFYDVNTVNLESDVGVLGMGLIGFKNRQYLSDLGLTDTAQVKFYQGYIKEKGTINAINALATVSLNGQETNVSVNEEWAFRVGTYGSATTNKFIDIVLDDRYTINNPTSLEATGNTTVVYGSVYANDDGVYNYSDATFSTPFLLNRTSDSDTSEDIKTAGYVNIDDVDHTVFDVTNIANSDISINDVHPDSVIWTAKDNSQDWNVYKVSSTFNSVSKISNNLNNAIVITTAKSHNLSVNEIVVLKNADKFNGFYIVKSIVDNNNFVADASTSLLGFSSKTFTASTALYKLISLRVDRASDIVNLPVTWKPGSKAWVDNNANNEWAVYEKSEPWTIENSLSIDSYTTNGKLGQSLALSNDGTVAVVGEPGYSSANGTGRITTYLKNTAGKFIKVASYTPSVTLTGSYGAAVAATDSKVIVGAPGSNSDTGKIYVYDLNVTTGLLTPDSYNPSFDGDSVAEKFGTSIALSKDNNWLYVGTPGTDRVRAYVLNGSNTFSYYTEITTPSVTGVNFGATVATTTDGRQISISAPLENSSQGVLYVYDRTTENFIADGVQTAFGGVRTPDSRTKVFVNGISTSYTISTNYVVVAPAPTAGSIVSVETNDFILIQTLSASSPQDNSQLGFSADICPFNCSLFAGAPYYTDGTKYQVGVVHRFLNQSRVYGEIVGTTLNPTVTIGHSIRLNDFEVAFTGTTLASVIDDINDANIPGVAAFNVDGYIKVTSDSLIAANKLTVLPGVGSAIDDLGLNVFVETEIISNPTNNAYDTFGYSIKVNSNSAALAIGGPEAYTYSRATFDVYRDLLSTSESIFDTKYVTDVNGEAGEQTTYDGGSTGFVDKVKSGAVWTMAYLPDNRGNINYPGVYAFAQQLDPSKLGIRLVPNIGFGTSVAIGMTSLLVGAPTDSAAESNGGIAYQFDNETGLIGWDIIRQQTSKVDLSCIVKGYTYNISKDIVIDHMDYIDPAKGKILGIAEQEITYKTDYDPAVYNNASSSAVSISSTFYWGSQQVGQVWWDLSTVRFLDYEQDTVKYRTTNWGRMFPNSSVDVYEWVESAYPPAQYSATGNNGEPKDAENTPYVTRTYIDPISSQAIVTYYFWVKNKSSVPNLRSRSVSTLTVADYIANPKNSGIKYFAAIKDNAVAVYNVTKDTVGSQVMFHLDYNNQLNNNIMHSEFALVSESTATSGTIPDVIYSKLVDSLSGIDAEGNTVPDPALPVAKRYGIEFRPRQSVFVNKNKALEQLITFVNNEFSKYTINVGFDLTTLNAEEPVPDIVEDAYDFAVADLTELSYIDITLVPVGYNVLVNADSTKNNLWTIYTKTNTDTWELTRTQSYRVRDYWKTVDWYASYFDRTTQPKYTFDTMTELAGGTFSNGDVVKVLDGGNGKWVLLQVFANLTITVGVQDGTVELLSTLYTPDPTNVGYYRDPGIEIRYIMDALRDDLFVNQLSAEFTTAFFILVKYVLEEQKSVDWVFKTSFINVVHKIKGLQQSPIYFKESQDFYRKYIEETKPYHTTIREYITDYEGTDTAVSYTTDFDLPATYDPVLRKYRSPSGELPQDASLISQPQYNDYLTSFTYEIGSVSIANGGTGYVVEPVLTVAGSTTNDNAVLRAVLSNGVISRVDVLYPGSNYVTQPTITITGGNGTGARLYAMLKNTTIRKPKTTLVYDRVTYNTTVVEWEPNTFYTQSSIIEYNGVAYIANADFTSDAVFNGNNLSIYKAENFSTANDRIQAYYQPTPGMPGKDFALLQSGIEYEGVLVGNLLFTDSNVSFTAEYLDSIIESQFNDSGLGIRPEDVVIDGDEFISTYTSHAPEELIPGRVFDTVDITVTTLSTLNDQAYQDWVLYNAFYVSSVDIIDGGTGFADSPTVTINGTTGQNATASASVDGNGTIISVTITSGGGQFTTVPEVTFTGANVFLPQAPARGVVRLSPSVYDTFSFRMFKDLNNNWSYYTARASATTELAEDLTITSNTISVVDSSVLSPPAPALLRPGVVFINGERITYWAKDDVTNTLSYIRRGTAGTGAGEHSAGSSVVDGSVFELVPNTAHTTWTPSVGTEDKITTSGNVYTFSNVGYYDPYYGETYPYIQSNLWLTPGVGLYPFGLLVEPFVSNASITLLTTESGNPIGTEQGADSPGDGTGLYGSSSEQANFVKGV